MTVQDCIEMAERGKSRLTDEALKVEGMTGIKVRHLLNNLAALSQNILEIGVHKGAMTVACNTGHQLLRYFVCDNWSQFNGDEKGREHFDENIKAHNIKCTVFEQDCFTIDLSKLPKIDMYIFDGDHNVEDHVKAMTYFKPVLAPIFILVVDDYSWWQVQKGTTDGILMAGMEVLYSKELGVGIEGDESGWWNGLFVALIKNK
jgi:hypothetical protein